MLEVLAYGTSTACQRLIWRPSLMTGRQGTTVQFHPDIAILVSPEVMAPEVTRANSWPQLRVVLVDERPR